MVEGLVCIHCRGWQGAEFVSRSLRPEGCWLLCDCGARYPVVDGIPLIFKDFRAFLASEAPVLLSRQDLGELGSLFRHHAGGALRRLQEQLHSYSSSSEGELQHWLEQKVGSLEGEVLEAGCGMGLCAGSVGLDYSFGLLQQSCCRRRVCADLGSPPFPAAFFDAVVLANVLDSCRDPALVLAQADALLRPGGMLVLTCAFAFSEEVTPIESWFEEEGLLAALRGEQEFSGYLFDYGLEEVGERSWPLQRRPRERVEFRTLCVVARKKGPSSEQ